MDNYDLRWLVRRKIDRLPNHADERDRAKFKKAASYMVLLDDKVACKRCRRTFEVSGNQDHSFFDGLPKGRVADRLPSNHCDRWIKSCRGS